MNQQKSLMNLLLVSTAALSGYKKGTVKQYKYDQYNRNYRNENTSAPANTMPYTNTTSGATNMPYTTTTSASTNMPYTTTPSNTTCHAYSNNTPQNMYTPSESMNTMANSPMTNLGPTMTGPTTSATALAQADDTFIPALLAALYAADEAVNINADATGPFTLPPLEYDHNALEPYISEETLRIHHQKLLQKYVNNLNTALSRYPEFYAYTLPELLLFPDRLPSDIQAQILTNAGGHYNHSLTWKLIVPANNSRPTGEFAQAVNDQFGSFENLKRVLKEAALSVVGTGYAWLTLNPYGRMIVVTSEEQLTPIPLRTVPLLPIDVWEHAYFLDQGESRSDYIDAFFNLVNWDRVGDRYLAAIEPFINAGELSD